MDKDAIERVFDRFNERWPQTGDRLLMQGRDAYLAADGDERDYRMPCGYKRAGDLLVQTAYADRSECNNLVFPVLFNYRHYVELTLKATVTKYGAVAKVARGAKSHDLPSLWRMFEKIAVAFDLDLDDPASKAVAECIAELDALDRRSTAFRYSRDIQGDVPELPSGWIDLVRLHDVMNGIANFFECVDLELHRRIEDAAETAAACM